MSFDEFNKEVWLAIYSSLFWHINRNGALKMSAIFHISNSEEIAPQWRKVFGSLCVYLCV